jgi:hypothetical protein
MISVSSCFESFFAQNFLPSSCARLHLVCKAQLPPRRDGFADTCTRRLALIDFHSSTCTHRLSFVDLHSSTFTRRLVLIDFHSLTCTHRLLLYKWMYHAFANFAANVYTFCLCFWASSILVHSRLPGFCSAMFSYCIKRCPNIEYTFVHWLDFIQ